MQHDTVPNKERQGDGEKKRRSARCTRCEQCARLRAAVNYD